MCREINIIVLLSLLVLSGCQTPNIEDTSSEAATDFSIEEPMQLTSSLSLKYLCKYYHMYLSSGSMSASAISSAVISSVLYVQ